MMYLDEWLKDKKAQGFRASHIILKMVIIFHYF